MADRQELEARLTFLREKLKAQENKRPRKRRVEMHLEWTRAEIKSVEEALNALQETV
jgi:hypothetical protein